MFVTGYNAIGPIFGRTRTENGMLKMEWLCRNHIRYVKTMD